MGGNLCFVLLKHIKIMLDEIFIDVSQANFIRLVVLFIHFIT